MKIKRAIDFIFSEGENFSLENRLILNSIIIGILTCLIGSFINFILNNNIISTVVPIFLAGLLLVLYYFLRFKKLIEPLLIPMIIISHVGISIIWVFNGGINGSNIFVGFVILILSLIAVNDKIKIYILSLFISLFILVFLIQLYRPDLIVNFPSESARWIDAVITLFYCSVFIYLIIRFLHKHYTLERIKVEESKKQLYQLNADKDLFISILAHDLKSPFNSILGYLELLSSNIHKYDINKIEDQIALINKSAHNTYNLLEDLLMWARSQSGKLPYNPKEVKLSNLVKDIVEILKPNSELKNIAINYFTTKDVVVFADIDMLKTIFRNLISNAMKFTQNGGNIDITTEQTDSNITISVSDNGIGISPAKLNLLFDISQIHSSKGTANESGTGLGLLLCKEFVEKHRGNISVESKVGKGTKFTIALPKRPKI